MESEPLAAGMLRGGLGNQDQAPEHRSVWWSGSLAKKYQHFLSLLFLHLLKKRRLLVNYIYMLVYMDSVYPSRHPSSTHSSSFHLVINNPSIIYYLSVTYISTIYYLSIYYIYKSSIIYLSIIHYPSINNLLSIIYPPSIYHLLSVYIAIT